MDAALPRRGAGRRPRPRRSPPRDRLWRRQVLVQRPELDGAGEGAPRRLGNALPDRARTAVRALLDEGTPVTAGDSDDARAAFERLFRDTRTDLLAYVMRRSPSAEDAADVLADTYLVAWQKLDAIPDGERAR